MVGEPGARSAQAIIVAEPVPARVLGLVPTEFDLEPSECTRPRKRIGETRREIRLLERVPEGTVRVLEEVVFASDVTG